MVLSSQELVGADTTEWPPSLCINRNLARMLPLAVLSVVPEELLLLLCVEEELVLVASESRVISVKVIDKAVTKELGALASPRCRIELCTAGAVVLGDTDQLDLRQVSTVRQARKLQLSALGKVEGGARCLTLTDTPHRKLIEAALWA